MQIKKGWAIVLIGLGFPNASVLAVEFGGFFDAQANFNTSASEGFVLDSGAVTARQKSGPWEGYLDFGIKNGVALDTLRSQAFVQYDSGFFGIGIGQFDSVFRYDPVDSIDRVLLSESLTDSASGLTLFTKLSGARAHLKLGGAKVTFFVVNPRNQPILGAGGNLDVAAQVSFDLSAMRLATGVLYNIDTALGWIWNTDFALDLGALGIKAGFVYKYSSSATAWALIAEPEFHISDSLDLAVRGEYLKPTSVTTSMQVSAGPQFKIEKFFRIKAEYYAASGTSTALNHGIGFAALAVF